MGAFVSSFSVSASVISSSASRRMTPSFASRARPRTAVGAERSGVGAERPARRGIDDDVGDRDRFPVHDGCAADVEIEIGILPVVAHPLLVLHRVDDVVARLVENGLGVHDKSLLGTDLPEGHDLRSGGVEVARVNGTRIDPRGAAGVRVPKAVLLGEAAT